MKRRVRVRVAAALAVIASVSVTVSTATAASAATPPKPDASNTQYYLALGDSLAKGYMPPAGDSDLGYVDDLYATLKATDPSLQLVKLGCSGETTTTMQDGGICSYPGAGSQLQAAEQFLRAHRTSVKYLTLDIGANDIQKCASGGTVNVGCAVSGLSNLAVNTVKILTGLRLAGGYRPTLVGMTYYNPFLAAWLTGTSGQSTARLSNTLLQVLNGIQSAEYQLFGGRVADIATAFTSADFTDQIALPGVGEVPVNVATICRLTYMCSVGNIHPNVAGYQLIATTFAQALGQPTSR